MALLPELEAIRRSQILDAAVRAIAMKGSTNVRMDDIVACSGLSKGGIAYYFPSKASLLQAVFTVYFDALYETVKKDIAEDPSVFSRIACIHMLFDRDREEVVMGYPLLADFMYHAMHGEEYRPIFAKWVDGWVALLVETLEKGVEEGFFLPMETVDTESVARSISAIYQGVGLRWFLAPKEHSHAWALKTLEHAVAGVLTPWLASGVHLELTP